MAMDVIRLSKDKHFVIFSDSMSSPEALSGFKLEMDLVEKIIKDYTALTISGKRINGIMGTFKVTQGFAVPDLDSKQYSLQLETGSSRLLLCISCIRTSTA